MTFKPLELQDCQNIAKAYERGCAYSVTEESVFAMMAPLLTGIRAQSATIVNQLESEEGLTSAFTKSDSEKSLQDAASEITDALGSAYPALNLDKLDVADEGDIALSVALNTPLFPTESTSPIATIISGLFDNECVPCKERLNMLGELNAAAFLDNINALLDQQLAWLANQIKQIQEMLSLFSNKDNYVDLCALLKFLSEFICVPDLQRILSALMALMSRVSFEFGGIFDIILGLIGPLVTPFLSGFVNLLQSYILMIVRPLECIIDSIQDIIRKLDYNVLFTNIQMLDKKVSIGSEKGVSGNIKIPFVNTHINYDLPPTGNFTKEFNLLGPAGTAVKQENVKNQQAVETAIDELERIDKASRGLDATDPAAMARWKEQREAASQKYKEAVQQRDLSALGRANQFIEGKQDKLRSSLYTLIGYLTEAIQSIEDFFQDVYDELKKIMGAYVSGGDEFVAQLIKKMGLVQMIMFIAAIIEAFANKLECEDPDLLRPETYLPATPGFQVWTDDEGNLHIDEDETELGKAIESMVTAIGVTAEVAAGVTVGSTNSSETLASQRLRSLIKFTGDPVLDIEIAKTTETLINPVQMKFKCPLQTSIVQTEQVNTWIEELNRE